MHAKQILLAITTGNIKEKRVENMNHNEKVKSI